MKDVESNCRGGKEFGTNCGKCPKCKREANAFKLDEAGNWNFPPHRPGIADFALTYKDGRDHLSSSIVIRELGDERFYDELFLGHSINMFFPGEERIVTVSFPRLELKQGFVKQIVEYGYREKTLGDVYEYCGLTINIL